MKKIFAVLAIALGLTGVFAGTASTASAAECELVRVTLTINGVLPTTQLVCV
jgi:hypothetical protein